jgi:hypothetical protein
MKKLLLSVTTAIFSLLVYATEPTAVNEKVLQAFHASFKDAQQVVWEEHTDMYEVRFLHNDIKSRITYDTEGNIMKTIRYYFEPNLPLLVRAKIKERFKGSKVFGVTEVSSRDEITYHVVLEGEKTWTNIECDAYGNTAIVKKFKKA